MSQIAKSGNYTPRICRRFSVFKIIDLDEVKTSVDQPIDRSLANDHLETVELLGGSHDENRCSRHD